MKSKLTHIPKIIYGTAWKKAATTDLVVQAVQAGFKAIDTANQPKHYSEELVGQAVISLQEQGISRQQLFLQTKFTPADGQDHRIPYDPNSDYATQVLTSFSSSLEHLKTDYIDLYLLHGPYSWAGLSQADWEVWKTLEKIHQSGKVKYIGISNVNLQQLELLVKDATIKPMIVQNRCFANQGWDAAVRTFCQNNNIIYQGFSLLTANIDVLQHPTIKMIAQRLHKTPAQIIFRFATQIGITPLTGTTDLNHMQEDLAIFDFELTNNDLELIAIL